jgi:hypothetical protein
MDFLANLAVLRLPLQPSPSVANVQRQSTACGGDSSIEGVQQH